MLSFVSTAAVDLYYIGFFDAAATYNNGTGREPRHTVGTRFLGSRPIGPGMLGWNYEGMLQFGSFDSQRRNGSILALERGSGNWLHDRHFCQTAAFPASQHNQRKQER
jgi:hypothetical protein